MPAVALRQITKVYRDRGGPVTALHQVDLEVRRGECLALVGPSGSGKTTALRLIAGLEEPTSGAVLLDGRDARATPPHARNLGLVFQDHPLFPHLDVAANLAFGLRRTPLSPPERDARVREVAALLGIDRLLHRLPASLSGGERQRVGLGTALVRRPALLLLDEPLARLDEPLRLRMAAEIRRIQRELGPTLILVTHDQAEAMAIGDRVAVLHKGEVQQVDPPAAVYDQPANLFVAGFVGSPAMNLIRARRDPAGGWVTDDEAFRMTGSRGPDEGTAEPLVIGVRPEHLKIAANGAGVPRAGVWQGAGRVEQVSYLGSESRILVRVGGSLFMARRAEGPQPEVGTRVTLWFEAERTHWFRAGDGRRLSPGFEVCTGPERWLG